MPVKWHKGTFAVLICFVFQLISRLNGDLTTVPENVVTLKGESVVLHCSTTDLQSGVQWTYRAAGSASLPVDVFIAGKISRRLESRYSIRRDVERQFDLVIDNTDESDAGTYTCVDRGGIGTSRAAAELVIVETRPSCQVSVANVIVNPQQPVVVLLGSNTCRIRSDILNLTCKSTYRGNIAPTTAWTLSGEPLHRDETQFQNVEGRIISSAIVPANRIANGDVCTFEMDLFHLPFEWTSPEIQIINDVNSRKPTSLSYEQCGTKPLHCSSYEAKNCSFRWVNELGKTISDGQQLSLQRIQPLAPDTYKCIADCSIRGRRCNITTDVILCDSYRSEKEKLTEAGITGTSLTVILSVFIVITFVLVAVLILVCCCFQNQNFKAWFWKLLPKPPATQEVEMPNRRSTLIHHTNGTANHSENNEPLLHSANGTLDSINVTAHIGLRRRQKGEHQTEEVSILNSQELKSFDSDNNKPRKPANTISNTKANEDEESQKLGQIVKMQKMMQEFHLQFNQTMDELKTPPQTSRLETDGPTESISGPQELDILRKERDDARQEAMTTITELKNTHAEEILAERRLRQSVQQRLDQTEMNLKEERQDHVDAVEMLTTLQARVRNDNIKHQEELSLERRARRELEKELADLRKVQSKLGNVLTYRSSQPLGACNPQVQQQPWHPAALRTMGSLEEDTATFTSTPPTELEPIEETLTRSDLTSTEPDAIEQESEVGSIQTTESCALPEASNMSQISDDTIRTQTDDN